MLLFVWQYKMYKLILFFSCLASLSILRFSYYLLWNLLSLCPWADVGKRHAGQWCHFIINMIVAMYAASLCSGARKHYKVRYVLRRIFWNAHIMHCVWAALRGWWSHNVPYIHINTSRIQCHVPSIYVGFAQARPNYATLHVGIKHVGTLQHQCNSSMQEARKFEYNISLGRAWASPT